MTPSHLAWAHFRQSTKIGFLCFLVGAVLVGLGQAWMEQSPSAASSAQHLGDRLLGMVAITWVWALGVAWWGAIFLGIPALLFGVLRQPLMKRLFAYCRSHAPDSTLDLALVGTFVLFELPVGLIGILSSGEPAYYGYSMGVFCFGLSLPWLLGSLLATWSIRDELSTPA
jgi:hypothetical protein